MGSSAKHIAIDARIINSSTGTYVERLLHYLQENDTVNNYTVITRSEDIHFWKPTAKNFSVRFADYADYSFGEQLGFKRFLDELKPDLVHFCMPQQPVFYKGKKVTTIHDLTLLREYNSDKNFFVYKFKQLVGRFVFKKVARDSQAVIVPTTYTKQDLLSFVTIPADKIYITYEAATIGQFAPKKYDIPFTKFLLNVGQHSDYKNIVRLAEAHQRLLSKYPDLGLIFINKPTDALLKNEALFKKRGYKNIHFTYSISKNKRDYIYEHATVCVTPSIREGFGLPGLEAMGFGVPVVSSSATCLPEVYGDGAIFFDPFNVEEMAHQIDLILSDDSLRQNLIKKGKRRHAFFSWNKMAKETLAVYKNILGI